MYAMIPVSFYVTINHVYVSTCGTDRDILIERVIFIAPPPHSPSPSDHDHGDRRRRLAAIGVGPSITEAQSKNGIANPIIIVTYSPHRCGGGGGAWCGTQLLQLQIHRLVF